MSRLERNINLIAVFGPFVALAAIAPLAWHTDLLNWSDIAIFAVMYVVSGLGITVGYHRLLTHRAFQTHKWLEYAFAIVGGLAVQGRVIDWVADHRKHHAHTDEDGDPHSPHAARPVPRARRLAVQRAGPRAPGQVRARSVRGPGDAAHPPQLPLARAGDLRDPVRARVGGDPVVARGADSPAVGRPRARVDAPPRDLVDQQRLPLLRNTALRHRRSLDERLLARAALLRRVLAPQSPCVPALGLPRAAAVGDRPLGARRPRAAADGAGLERRR